MGTSVRLLLVIPVLLLQPPADISSQPPPTRSAAEARVSAGVGSSIAGPAECRYRIFPWSLITPCDDPRIGLELDPVELNRAESAVRLFTEQGLRLPNVTVTFHDSREGCNDHFGLYDPTTRRVHVCSTASHILPHELAHTWMVEHLDDRTRQAFLDLRGLDAWGDPGDEWRTRGVEDAAILMRMVLTENGGPENSPGWDNRRRAFELLTGRAHVPTG